MVGAAITVLIVTAMWLPPALAMTINRLDPDIGTALGVPYGFLAGLILATVGTGVVAILSQRWASLRPNYLIVLGAAAATILSLIFADRGLLSVTA
ncbi:MAG: hypothetical protein AAGB04_17920 [Pseudomonadota bacterium]